MDTNIVTSVIVLGCIALSFSAIGNIFVALMKKIINKPNEKNQLL